MYTYTYICIHIHIYIYIHIGAYPAPPPRHSCQLYLPELAVARTQLLDYFGDLARAAKPDHLLFRFERSMELGEGEATLLAQVRESELYVTAGTDIAVTAISAPAVAPLPDGVRPRSF